MKNKTKINKASCIFENIILVLNDCEPNLYWENIEIVKKSLKALELIKKKRVDVQLLEECEDVDIYNWCVKRLRNRKLTQKEFNLLKEVLI